MEGFYKIVAGQFGNVEAVFKVYGPVDEFPISSGSSGNPRLSCFIIHNREGLGYNQVGC